MAVPANIAVAWPSTAASIPAGWVRETSLDGMYVVGATAGANADLSTPRGSASHIHTSPAHVSVQDAHFHTGSSGNPTSGRIKSIGGAPLATVSVSLHQHTFTTASAVAVNDSLSIDVDPTTNDLAYTGVIWIKSLGSAAGFPAGSIVFWSIDALPAGWSRTAGGWYLKGAAAAGDGGGTGGANTHTHTSPAHTHTQQTHNHGTLTSDLESISGSANNTSNITTVGDHTHNVTLSDVAGTNQPVVTTLSTNNHEPPYTILNAITSAALDYPLGAIALWLGANGSIPTGWSRYTALDGRWLKTATVDGQVGTTGGSSTHTHTASSCLPVQDVHDHDALTDAGPSATVARKTGTTVNVPNSTHKHSWATDGTTVPTNQAAAVTIDPSAAEDAYPPYRTAIFVRLDNASGIKITGTTTYVYGVLPRNANREDLPNEDLLRAAYRTRRRGEG